MRLFGLVLQRSTPEVHAVGKDPCCMTCDEPLEMYYSADAKHGFCGEECLDPPKLSIYKIFVKNPMLKLGGPVRRAVHYRRHALHRACKNRHPWSSRWRRTSWELASRGLARSSRRIRGRRIRRPHATSSSLPSTRTTPSMQRPSPMVFLVATNELEAH